MARRKLARKAKHDDDDGRVIVTTSRGRRVECLPTQMVIDQVRELYGDMKPDAPEYTVTDVGGAQEVRRYTETTITGPNVSDEDKQKWVEYLAEVARIDREYNDHVLRVVAVECIKILDMPPEDEWVKRDKWIYGENVIPDDPDERLYHYFKTKVIGTQQDGYDIMLGIHRASGVDEEVLASLEASFRSEVEDEDGLDAEPDEGDTTPGEP